MPVSGSAAWTPQACFLSDELNSLPAPVLHGLVRACSANESALSYKLLQCVDGWALLTVATVQISQTHMAIYLAFMHASHRSCISIYNIVILHTVDHFWLTKRECHYLQELQPELLAHTWCLNRKLHAPH